MSHSIGTAPHATSSDVTLIPPQADWPPPRSLRSRALCGSIWTIAGYGTAQVLRLGSNLLLTRLLFPRVFGLMALVNLFMQGLEMFSDVGIGPSIIRHRRGDDPDFLNTAWTIQVVRGLILWSGSVLIAWPVAAFYGVPQLVWLLPISGLTAIIQGFNSTSLFVCNRHLAIGRLTLLELGVQAITIAAMAALALIRPTVWVLVAGGLVGSLVKMALSHVILPGPTNRFYYSITYRYDILSFGKWIFVSSLIAYCAMQIDRLLVGKLVTLDELGVYSIAVMIAQLPRGLFQKLSDAVIYPAVSEVSQDFEVFRDRTRLTRRMMLLFSGPFCAALVALGLPVVRVLYDERYRNAGFILSVSAVGVWLQIISVSYGPAILAAGMPKYISYGLALRMVIFLVLVWPAFHSMGVLGVAGVTSASELGVVGACLVGARRVGVASLVHDLVLSLGVAAMALAISAAYAVGSSGLGGDGGGLTVSGLAIGAMMLLLTGLFRRIYRSSG